MEDLTGRQFGPYRIVAPLGEGGMAAVYKAFQPSMERYVAIKVLPRHLAASPEFVARFNREAKLLAQLQHPNILPVFDFGEAEGFTYIVMPFVESGTLGDAMQKQRFSLPEVRDIMVQLGRALGYAHARGMIHRDIKPSNVLMDQSHNCLLTDFGLARMTEVTSGLTASGSIMGTPSYMSPEQGTGENLDGRSDIYSLGIIFYELVTGRVPFSAETPIAIIYKHLQDPLPLPRSINPGLPEEAERVLLKALAKSRDDRYQTADEFVRAVQKALPESEAAEKTLLTDASGAATLLVGQTANAGSALAEERTVSASGGEKQGPPTVAEPGSAKAAPAARSSRLPVWILVGAGALVLMLVVAFVALNALNKGPASPPPTSVANPAPGTNLPTYTPRPAPTSTPLGSGQLAPSPADCASEDVFCAALVTDADGRIDDRSFNQSCWEGVQQAQTDGVADAIDYIESTDAGDYGNNLAAFADTGYDAIVTCGFDLTEDTYAAAGKYPGTFFIGVDQFMFADDAHPDLPLTNLVGVIYPEDQSGFLVGALAAAMSETHKIGAIAGTDAVPPVWRYGEGYKAGAAYADGLTGTTTDVNVIYHSEVGFDKTFTDPEWGATTANAMMDQGVDVIFGIGGTTGNGGVTAAAQRGLFGIGVDTDQYFTLPEAAPRLLSSALKPIQPSVASLIAAAEDGSFEGGLFLGGSGYAPYHDLDVQVPAEVKSMMQEILAGLTDGSIRTGVAPFKP